MVPTVSGPAGAASRGMSSHVTAAQDHWPPCWLCSCKTGPSPPHCSSPHATFCCQSYLPGKEPTDTDDAQDIEHCRAHDGSNSHVALGDEDP